MHHGFDAYYLLGLYPSFDRCEHTEDSWLYVIISSEIFYFPLIGFYYFFPPVPCSGGFAEELTSVVVVGAGILAVPRIFPIDFPVRA